MTTRSLDLPWELGYIERVIKRDYGVSASIEDKLKTLLKFGLNPVLGTSYEDVTFFGGTETLPTTNAIDSISSSDGGDTGQVQIEYHTVEGTGTEQKFTFGVQTATLTGQARSPLTVPAARASRLRVPIGQPAFAGTVTVYENTALSGGVPIDTTKIHLSASPTVQKSQKAASTISDEDFYIVTQAYGGLTEKAAGVAKFQFMTRPPGGVFESVLNFASDQPPGDLHPPLIVPRNHDFKFIAIGSTTNLEIEAYCNGYLAKVKS